MTHGGIWSPFLSNKAFLFVCRLPVGPHTPSVVCFSLQWTEEVVVTFESHESPVVLLIPFHHSDSHVGLIQTSSRRGTRLIRLISSFSAKLFSGANHSLMETIRCPSSSNFIQLPPSVHSSLHLFLQFFLLRHLFSSSKMFFLSRLHPSCSLYFSPYPA